MHDQKNSFPGAEALNTDTPQVAEVPAELTPGAGENKEVLSPVGVVRPPQPSPSEADLGWDKGYAYWLALSALVIILDQWAKHAITSHFQYGETFSVTRFFDLVLAHNQGAAFGLLNDAGGWQRWLFTAIAVGASAWVVQLLRKHWRQKLFCLALALILGGALGNLADRIAYGFVVDFLDFHWSQNHFPAFNLADSAITLGAILLLLESFLNKPVIKMELLLANPRGFCAGVDRAIEIVERALELHGAPIYVRHEVVHNRFVVDSLKAKGAIFIEDLADVPSGSILIFSAHGVSQAVRREAEARGLTVFDATCPLVTKVHIEVTRMREQGKEVVMIGHAGPPEVEGTMGQGEGGMYLVESPEDVPGLAVKDENNLAFVTQTTLSMDDAGTIIAALKSRFPNIVGPKKDDICYATQNRQDAVKQLARQCDVVIVVGSPNSSNSNRLREVARNMNVPAYLVDNAAELKPEWLAGKRHVGISAGASAPEVLVREVIERLKALGAGSVRELEGINENVVFPLPKLSSPHQK